MRKKIKIAVFSAAGVLALGASVWFGAGKLQQGEIDVFAVQDLSQSMWEESTSLSGNITSNVSQEVRLQENQIVSQVYVQEGQEVKEGDTLLSYDMTLVSLDLEMEKLNKRQLEIKKKGLEQDLANLEKDKTKLTGTFGNYKAETLGKSGKTWSLSKTAQELPQGIVTEETGREEGDAQNQSRDGQSGKDTQNSQTIPQNEDTDIQESESSGQPENDSQTQSESQSTEPSGQPENVTQGEDKVQEPEKESQNENLSGQEETEDIENDYEEK